MSKWRRRNAWERWLGGKGRGGEAFISRLDAQARDIVKIFENSDWSQKEAPNTITIQNMALVMMLAQVVKSNKGVVQERLYKDIKPNIKLGEVDYLLKGYAEIDPSCSTYVLAASAESHTQRHSRARASTPHRGRSPSRQRQVIECYNCHKYGHSARDCYANVTCSNCQYQGHKESVCRNPPWCSYHHRIGHKTAECRARTQNFHKGQKDKTETS